MKSEIILWNHRSIYRIHHDPHNSICHCAVCRIAWTGWVFNNTRHPHPHPHPHLHPLPYRSNRLQITKHTLSKQSWGSSPLTLHKIRSWGSKYAMLMSNVWSLRRWITPPSIRYSVMIIYSHVYKWELGTNEFIGTNWSYQQQAQTCKFHMITRWLPMQSLGPQKSFEVLHFGPGRWQNTWLHGVQKQTVKQLSSTSWRFKRAYQEVVRTNIMHASNRTCHDDGT